MIAATPALVALCTTGPAAAQQAPDAAALAAVALSVCVQNTTEAGSPAAEGFVQERREGRTHVYVHPAGPRLTTTASPGFFACEITVYDAPPALHDAMLAEISPAMQTRFDLIEPKGIETGLAWDATSPEGYSVTAALSLEEDGTLRFTSATQTDEAEPSPAQRDN